VEALFLNFLIGVTSFFRDPEAYRAIEEQIIPKMFADKSAMDGLIRVWSAGCSTGESTKEQSNKTTGMRMVSQVVLRGPMARDDVRVFRFRTERRRRCSYWAIASTTIKSAERPARVAMARAVPARPSVPT
jgi:hypothetical protein